MKKQYTKKQISEALSTWKKQLKTGKSKYTARQVKEAISYWTKRLDEAVNADQLADFAAKNKWTKEDALKNVDKIADEFDMDANAQRDYIEKMINSVDFKDAKGGDAKGGDGKKAEAPAVPEKTEKAIAADVIDDDEDASANEAVKSPVGKLNILGRFYRIHVNAVKNATAAVAKFLNSKKVPVPETGITFTNSFADDDAGKFELKDEPMVITLEVEVDRASVKGFRKFMAVMLKEAAEQKGEEIDEGILGTLASAFGAAKEKGKEKAAESIKKANEELKAQIGVAGLQEYVKRFCGPKLAKLINHKVIFDGMNEDKGELVYKYSVAYTVEQG